MRGPDNLTFAWKSTSSNLQLSDHRLMGKASQAGYGCWERLLMLPDEAVKIPGKQKLTKDADRRTITLR